uniref:mRNA-decapping enzyme C-terminal domain-containing protein n=1 Tax=Anopheles culicifacies TaxID=139723 RepID=A0A182M703_9DIPT
AKQPAASEVPLFKTLAPVHTLEQIEKQHRATTPQKDATTGKVTPDVNELENSFKRMGIPIVTGGGGNNGPQTPSAGMSELGTSPLATFINAASLSAAMRANHHQPVVPKTKLIEISELESRQNAQQQQQQQQQQTPLHELLKKSDPVGGNGTGAATVVKPALMPPTMFKPTASPAAAQEALSSLLLGGTTPSTNSPAGTNSNLINNNATAAVGVEPLTQNQLIQAVSYLIKHDPDFVRKLHEAYVKSFTEMISN